MKTWNDISLAQRILYTEWYLGRPLRDAEKLFLQTVEKAENEGKTITTFKTRHKPEPMFDQTDLNTRLAELGYIKLPSEDKTRDNYWLGVDPISSNTKASDGIVSMMRQQKIVPYEKRRTPVAQYIGRSLQEMTGVFMSANEASYWYGSSPTSNYTPPKRTKWQRLYIKVVALVALRQRITDLKTAGQYFLLAFGVGKRPESLYNED